MRMSGTEWRVPQILQLSCDRCKWSPSTRPKRLLLALQRCLQVNWPTGTVHQQIGASGACMPRRFNKSCLVPLKRKKERKKERKNERTKEREEHSFNENERTSGTKLCKANLLQLTRCANLGRLKPPSAQAAKQAQPITRSKQAHQSQQIAILFPPTTQRPGLPADLSPSPRKAPWRFP